MIKSLGTLPGSASYLPFVVKADEYNYLKTGHQNTGSMFSCSSVGTKVGMGLGTALCGWLLEWSRFDGTAAVQSSLASNVIIAIYLLAPIIAAALTQFIYYKLDVEEEITRLNKKKTE